jgi:hypothetical protein
VQLRKIRVQGYGTDAFGRQYHVRYMQVDGLPYRYDSCRSILALIAQSYELALLAPVVGMAREEGDAWSITMYLHDGICIDVRDKRHRGRVAKRLQKAVAEEAALLGIHTELEIPSDL